jgi:prophage antirepressor-like protein
LGRTNFDFNTNTIRVVEIDGNPWFVAVDVCKTLGFALNRKGIPNTSQACRPLNTDERGVYLINTPQPKCPEYSQKLTLITESGLKQRLIYARQRLDSFV